MAGFSVVVHTISAGQDLRIWIVVDSTVVSKWLPMATKRLGSVIEDRCKEANELIKKVKRFRNKWVAHTEMPEEAIGTTYTDVELLASLAEDLLFPFSLYFKTKHSYSDVVRQQQAFQFSRELGRLFDILPQK